MLKNDLPHRQRDPLILAFWAIAAVTLYRVVLLGFSTADLFVDEAQYWVWGQNLDWGYYSKPPMVGWLLRAVTDLAGSSSAFWVRMPGAILHAATALILMGAAREFADRGTAAMVGLFYITMPAVALGSFMVSTDTVLMPFFAGTIWAWLRLTRGPDARLAMVLGLFLGLGMMSKYAAIYAVVCAPLGAMFVREARITWRDAVVAAVTFAVVVSPNVIWNLQNDLATLSHTADNVDWVKKPGVTLNVSGAVEFFVAQFAVFGPVLFGAYLIALVAAVRAPNWQARWFGWISAPFILLVTVQALLSRAYANWAVTACVGMVLLAVPFLWPRFRWVVWIGIALNMVLTLAIPAVATQATTWRLEKDGQLVMRRYVGRADLSRHALDLARTQGVQDIVADDRDMLADLFHTGRDSGLNILAQPHKGHAPHYFAQKLSYPAERDAPALYLGTSGVPPCEAELIEEYPVHIGAYAGRTIRFYLTPAGCWRP